MRNLLIVLLAVFTARPLIRRKSRPESRCVAPVAPVSERRRLTSFPDALDANFRLACNEIAEELSKHDAFRRKMSQRIWGGIAATAGGIATLLGVGFWALLGYVSTEAKLKISEAHRAVEMKIAEEFQRDSVQKTVEAAAGKESTRLLASSVEPSIANFREKIDSLSGDVDQRFSAFQTSVKRDEQELTSKLQSASQELARLKKHNDISALAAKAINEGDVSAYRKLDEMTKGESDPEWRNASAAELVQVIQMYSMFGPTRAHGVRIIASVVNPSKKDESELTIEELLPLLSNEQPIARAKIAELIRSKAKKGSFRVATALIEAIKKETHLEAFKDLGEAFDRVAGVDISDTLDMRDHLKWWEENKDRLKAMDTDHLQGESPSPP